MADIPKPTPASPEEIEQALAHSLLFEGRRRHHKADDTTARIVAGILVRHLELAGFVVMRKPPLAPRATHGPSGTRRSE